VKEILEEDVQFRGEHRPGVAGQSVCVQSELMICSRGDRVAGFGQFQCCLNGLLG